MVVHEVRIQNDVCTYCEKQEGRFQEDPFLAEVKGDVSLYFICDDCAHQASMDI